MRSNKSPQPDIRDMTVKLHDHAEEGGGSGACDGAARMLRTQPLMAVI